MSTDLGTDPELRRRTAPSLSELLLIFHQTHLIMREWASSGCEHHLFRKTSGSFRMTPDRLTEIRNHPEPAGRKSPAVANCA